MKQENDVTYLHRMRNIGRLYNVLNDNCSLQAMVINGVCSFPALIRTVYIKGLVPTRLA